MSVERVHSVTKVSGMVPLSAEIWNDAHSFWLVIERAFVDSFNWQRFRETGYSVVDLMERATTVWDPDPYVDDGCDC